MSTRSRIGVIRKADTTKVVVESIYCHFDGYPEGVGKTLSEHWTDPEDVNRLIALGDISSLGIEIGEAHDFDKTMGRSPWEIAKDTTLTPDEVDAIWKKENAESPHGKGWTTAYGRDRAESGIEAAVHGMDNWPESGQEALYLFDPDTRTWRCASDTQNPVGWNTVAQWEGWITIPEAIQREREQQEKWEAQEAAANAAEAS